MKTGRIALLSCATMALAGAAWSARADVFGPEWVEDGDAGSLPNGAQNTSGEGSLGFVRGTLFGDIGVGGDFEDMFYIRIVDVKNFSVTTFQPGFAEFDSQLWLFRADGRGLLANDEGGGEGTGGGQSFLGPNSNDDSGFRVERPGVYLLCITAFNNDPFSEGGFMYDQRSRFEISGADGQGGELPIVGWQNDGGDSAGGERQYRMALTGVTFANVPSPGALAALGLAGLFGRRRRRVA